MKIIPVSLDVHGAYAKKLNDLFIDHDLRSELDMREEKLGYKIRDAQTLKVPFQLVVGDNEVNDNKVTFRRYGKQEQTTVDVEEFITLVKEEVFNKGQ